MFAKLSSFARTRSAARKSGLASVAALVLGSSLLATTTLDASSASANSAAIVSSENLPERADVDPPHRRNFLARIARGFAYSLSQKFGNLTGAIKLRKGRLKRDLEIYAALRTVLRPGDILFEKNGGLLTDQLIPGRLGHTAIYMGTGEELAQLGFPVEPPSAVREKDYLSDYLRPWVVEALRSGVQVNSLEHFMNIDEIYVLRPHYANREEVRATLQRALDYVGTRYDFLFDLEDDRTIYCTELVTRALPGYDWKLQPRLGIQTIDVDTLLIQAMTRMGFDPVAAVYHRTFYRSNGLELRTRIESLFRIHPDGTPVDSQI